MENNNKDMIDDILDESFKSISKEPVNNSSFKMPDEINAMYNASEKAIEQAAKPAAVVQDVMIDDSTDEEELKEVLPEQPLLPEQNQQVIEQSVAPAPLPVVENSVVEEKPKKKGKAFKIIILILLILITSAALAVYIIGIENTINFIKKFI